MPDYIAYMYLCLGTALIAPTGTTNALAPESNKPLFKPLIVVIDPHQFQADCPMSFVNASSSASHRQIL